MLLANGKATRALYDMLISFGRMSEPLTKVRMVTLTGFLYAGGDMKKASKETTIIPLIFRLVGKVFSESCMHSFVFDVTPVTL